MEDSINKMLEDKLRLSRISMEEEWKLTEMRIKEEWEFAQARMEDKLKSARLELEDRLQQVQTEIMEEAKRILEEKGQKLNLRRMELKMKSKISLPILACEYIYGEGSNGVEVALVDSSTEHTIVVGPEASAIIEIVVLNKGIEVFNRDDWTAQEFKEMIVPEVKGKKPLLDGNVCIKLHEGVGVFEKVKFRVHATKALKPPEFRLGVRIVDAFDGILVKEATTEPFVLKDYRQKYYRKHGFPSLSDSVSRLNNIRKGGMIEKRLKKEGIDTVEKFLIQLLKDHQGLKEIVDLKGRKWEAPVNHARKCQGDGRRYLYMNSGSGVVFDLLGKVQGLFTEGHYTLTNMLSENKKDDAHELFSSAIKHWDEIKLFYDDDALQQHFASASGEHHVAGASEERGECEFSDINQSSDEHGLQRSDSFGIHDVEILGGMELVMLNSDINQTNELLRAGIDVGSFVDECETQWQESVNDMFMEPAAAPMIKAIEKWKVLTRVFLCSRKMVAFKATRK